MSDIIDTDQGVVKVVGRYRRGMIFAAWIVCMRWLRRA
jgi:hypothetical protein